MNCLQCGGEMMNHLVQTRGQELCYDVCKECGGLWLDRGELDKMAFEVDGSIEYCTQEPDEGGNKGSRACPRCEGQQVLDRVKFLQYGDITLDRCPNCGGFWMDGGELDAIDEDLEKIMPIRGKGFSEFLRNAHLPYWHKRIRRKSSETDFRLEAPPVRGARLVSQTELRCPACAATLDRYQAFGIDIEGCPACKGIFLDEGELRSLKDKCKEALWHNLRWMDDEVEAVEQANSTLSDRVCPRCQDQRLLTTNFGDSEILIDYCPGCHGVWLDQGELRAVTHYLASRLSSFPTGQMVKKAWDEVKEICGGPEGVVSEGRDALAAIAALLSVNVFCHPPLRRMLASLHATGRSMGLG